MDEHVRADTRIVLREHEQHWTKKRRAETFLENLPREPVFKKINELLDEVKLERGDHKNTVLDCGCGVGHAYPYIDKTKWKYAGIDFTSSFVEECKKRYENINVREASVLDLPFADKTFTASFCEAVLEHLAPEDVKQAAHEMMRVTRKRVIFGFFRAPNPQPTKINWHGSFYMNNYNKMEWMKIIVDFPRVNAINLHRVGRFAFYVVDLWL